MNDPKCPDELKILISDRITAHYKYLEGRKDLFTAKTKHEKFTAANKTVESFLENRAIWQELDHYNKHGVVLGQHKLFFRFNKLVELNAKTTEELCDLRENIEHSIWRNNDLIEKGAKPHLNNNRLEKIEDYEWEIVEIQKIIDVRK